MRKSLLILLVIEFVLAVALGQLAHVDRPAVVRAWNDWRQQPTAEHRQAFDRERRIIHFQRWGLSGVAFAVLAGATILLYRVRRGEPAASGDAGGRAQQVPGLSGPARLS